MKKPNFTSVGRFTELRGAAVLDADDQPVGHVSDLRLRPEPRRGQPTLTITGIIVDRRHTGALLGYERRRQQGPWLVRTVMRALHRHAVLIPWSAVDHITTDQAGQRYLYLKAGQTSSSPETE